MKTRLDVLIQIKKYIDKFNFTYSSERAIRHNGFHSRFSLEFIIKAFYHCITNNFSAIDTPETSDLQNNLTAVHTATRDRTLAPCATSKLLEELITQFVTNKPQMDLAEINSTEEKFIRNYQDIIYSEIIHFLSHLNENQVNELNPEILQILTLLLSREQLAELAASPLLSKILKKNPNRRKELMDFAERIALTITTIKEFAKATSDYNQDFSESPELMKKGSALLKSLDDLKELEVKSLDLLSHLKLSTQFIQSACDSIQTFEELEILWKKSSAILLLAKEPLFSYRIFIELNLTSEQFFKLCKLNINHGFTYPSFSYEMLNLMINSPLIIAKVNHFIQSSQDLNIFHEGIGYLIIEKIVENKKESVTFFNKFFANNLNYFFQYLSHDSTANIRKHLFLTKLISHDENRRTFSQKVTAPQLEHILKWHEYYGYNVDNKYFALSSEDEISNIVKRIYPDFETFFQHVKTINLASNSIMDFLFKYEKPRQYIAGLFNSAEQLLKFYQLKTGYNSNPAQTIADTIFAKPLKPFFTASIENDEILIAFPEHRTILIAEKIQEAIPHNSIKDINRIIASYLFFAPPRVMLIEPVETNQLALDRKI